MRQEATVGLDAQVPSSKKAWLRRTHAATMEFDQPDVEEPDARERVQRQATG
jgi:hypothetical protein